MNTRFINSENSKTSDPHGLLLNLTDKIDLRRKDKFIVLSKLSIVFTIHGKVQKQSCKNNKFNISAPTWNEESELPDRLYSIPEIQDYFEYILEKHGEKTFNPLTRIYIHKIEKNHV